MPGRINAIYTNNNCSHVRQKDTVHFEYALWQTKMSARIIHKMYRVFLTPGLHIIFCSDGVYAGCGRVYFISSGSC
jgi:hypothetical protein